MAAVEERAAQPCKSYAMLRLAWKVGTIVRAETGAALCMGLSRNRGGGKGARLGRGGSKSFARASSMVRNE
jgi:hypothetical protein